MMISRRTFFKVTSAGALTLWVTGGSGVARAVAAPVAGAALAAASIDQFASSLLVPPVMPRSARLVQRGGKNVDYYEIAVRQFSQQVLPEGHPPTTVWGYGPLSTDRKGAPLTDLFHAPSLTIEARTGTPVRVKWINGLVDSDGNYLPHLLPVDPTLHWANPGRLGSSTTDSAPDLTGKTYIASASPSDAVAENQYTRYWGPVPIVTHVHGAVGVGDESDGYPEAWYLPAAVDLPDGYEPDGTWYDFFKAKASARFGVTWEPGSATFQYPNDNLASTIWYHDHALGLTRLNVYAGPAGFYLLRGGLGGDDAVRDSRSGQTAVLPGPAPKYGDPGAKKYYEIPIAIQDRSFTDEGQLFYPDARSYFDEYTGPFVPETSIPPIWNPEVFGNTLIVNGRTWPYLTVEQRRYRFRFLNGCQSRFLILDFSGISGVSAWQIGNDGGFLPAPVDLTGSHAGHLLLGPAERADIVVDFTSVPLGNHVLGNLGPDEPFGGGVPGVDFPVADPDTTGRVMQFRVVAASEADPSTPPEFLTLPAALALPTATVTRRLALLEHSHDDRPTAAMLGWLSDDAGNPWDGTDTGHVESQMWADAVTTNPAVGATEVWEFYNASADAHPVHVHEVTFEVLSRQEIEVEDGHMVSLDEDAPILPPEPWERGRKDTVIALPEQVTRIRATFANAGQYVWHCHILEHEDNEMMLPFRIGPAQPGEPPS
ncbi:MAG: multicopper oxidase family protein [Actinomycetes bacterium]